MTHCSAYRHSLFFVAIAIMALFGSSCGNSTDNNQDSFNGNQDGPLLGVSAGDVATPLAIAGFQFIATQALQQECDAGQATACKIAFAVNPVYKVGKTQEQIEATLKSMNDKLGDMDIKLNNILGKIQDLESALNKSVAELMLDSANISSHQYVLNVYKGYEALQTTDFLNDSGKALPIVRSVLSSYGNNWNLPESLDSFHRLVVGDGVILPGLLNRMNGMLRSVIDGIWASGRRPTDTEALNGYKMMEQYFGFLLALQAKGVLTISSSYNYLTIFPDPYMDTQPAPSTFSIYKKEKYDNHIEEQIKTFLKYVEDYIAYTADVDLPGTDGYDTEFRLGAPVLVKKPDLKGWTSEAFKRADLMAAWARASLKKQDPASADIPALLVVRILGEPERSKLLYNNDAVSDWLQSTPSNVNVNWYKVDKEFLKLNPTEPEEYRIVTSRKPYIQFPIYVDESGYFLKRNSALIKGANSYIMNKYILTDKDGLACKTCEKREVHALVGTYSDGGAEFVKETMEVKLVGPDGNAPQPDDPAMYYGHVTLVLKETAARVGIWSHGGAGEIKNQSIDNLTNKGAATDAFPQSAQLYVYADPHASDNQCNPADSACTPKFYAKGHGYYYEQLMGVYRFEGWGDVPKDKESQINAVLSGKTTHSITLPGNNGSNSLELYFAMSGSNQSASSTATGSVGLSVTSDSKLTPSTDIKINVEPRIKLDWDATRTSAPYKGGTCTFQGTMDFDMSNLALQVK